MSHDPKSERDESGSAIGPCFFMVLVAVVLAFMFYA
jgi:hypothetical protein